MQPCLGSQRISSWRWRSTPHIKPGGTPKRRIASSAAVGWIPNVPSASLWVIPIPSLFASWFLGWCCPSPLRGRLASLGSTGRWWCPTPVCMLCPQHRFGSAAEGSGSVLRFGGRQASAWHTALKHTPARAETGLLAAVWSMLKTGHHTWSGGKQCAAAPLSSCGGFQGVCTKMPIDPVGGTSTGPGTEWGRSSASSWPIAHRSTHHHPKP